MATDLVIGTHEQTTRMDSHELVRQLNSHLGATLVAALAGVRDKKLPHKWAKADGPEPRPEAWSRLTAAQRVWAMIATAESESIARSWFIGANPRLGEESPVMALREGNIPTVIGAATAFVEGTDD